MRPLGVIGMQGDRGGELGGHDGGCWQRRTGGRVCNATSNRVVVAFVGVQRERWRESGLVDSLKGLRCREEVKSGRLDRMEMITLLCRGCFKVLVQSRGCFESSFYFEFVLFYSVQRV